MYEAILAILAMVIIIIIIRGTGGPGGTGGAGGTESEMVRIVAVPIPGEPYREHPIGEENGTANRKPDPADIRDREESACYSAPIATQDDRFIAETTIRDRQREDVIVNRESDVRRFHDIYDEELKANDIREWWVK